MTQEELNKIVEQHQHWLKEDCEGWEDMKADLSGANLSGADLSGANLSGADLSGADLSGADLSGADKFRLGKVLDEPLTGYKKTMEGVVITAEIPAGAIVFCINGSKCRTNKAKITDMDGHEVLHSQYDNSFEYRLGQEIEIKDFNLMYNVECARVKHKTIQQLRDNLKKVLKRARPKQLKKLRKAYHGKRLKKWWSDYANADGCNTIAELKDFEGAGHRMKGGKRHNHVYNKCHKYVFRGKNARKIDRNDKKEFVRIFYIGLKLNRNFSEFLHKIFHKNNRSTAQQGKG